MIKRSIYGLLSFLLVSQVFASPNSNSNEMCEGVACFSQFEIVAGDTKSIQQAPQYAWLKSSGSGGWAFGGSASDVGGSSWFTDVPRTGPINSRGTFVFYPSRSVFAAYDSLGNLVTSGRASGGMNFCPDIGRPCHTPVGTFRVQSIGDAGCISNTYPIEEGGGAHMPYCMHFGGGYAVHGSDYVPNRPASHGCIRVTPDTAAWLSQNFMQVGTVVKVYSY